MDKLSTWQLVGELEDVPDKPKEDRDWMQRFCEDVVEPLYVLTSTSSGLLFTHKG